VENLRQIARYAEIGWAHVSACASAPLSAPSCKSAWTWATVALLAIGLIVLWKLLVWVLRPLAIWIAERKARAREDRVADAETMARYKVDDNKLFSTPGEDNIQRQIRDALDRKKVDEQHQRHHQTLGNKKV
jgi:flagellar biosynthesis/type III secretory pathway M-ring protein FliF/YscJ